MRGSVTCDIELETDSVIFYQIIVYCIYFKYPFDVPSFPTSPTNPPNVAFKQYFVPTHVFCRSQQITGEKSPHHITF